MKRKRQYESRVKTNAVIIYFLASLLCVGMIYYISNLKDSIDFQKRNIEKNETLLELTNELIDDVNNAYSYSNIYTFSADENHLNNFNISLDKIDAISDSIIYLCNDDFNKELLIDVKNLLIKKEEILKDINRQLNSFNPFKEIYSIVENYKPKNKNATVNRTINDTIIYKSEKKGFFERLGEVFSPSSLSDSIVLVSVTTIDTITEDNDETQELLKDRKSVV